jgi:glycosyltransferase involved in cell wall biosynthesis
MKHAKAVIQPSLFEGWSTVIEDAMAMNQVIIASDLEVNAEQLGENAIYFKRNCAVDLANCIEKIDKSHGLTINYDYSKKISDFAEGIQALID